MKKRKPVIGKRMKGRAMTAARRMGHRKPKIVKTLRSRCPSCLGKKILIIISSKPKRIKRRHFFK